MLVCIASPKKKEGKNYKLATSYGSKKWLAQKIYKTWKQRDRDPWIICSGPKPVLASIRIFDEHRETKATDIFEYTDLVSRRSRLSRLVLRADSSCVWPCPPLEACPWSEETRCSLVDPCSSIYPRWVRSVASLSRNCCSTRSLASTWSNTQCWTRFRSSTKWLRRRIDTWNHRSLGVYWFLEATGCSFDDRCWFPRFHCSSLHCWWWLPRCWLPKMVWKRTLVDRGRKGRSFLGSMCCCVALNDSCWNEVAEDSVYCL